MHYIKTLNTNNHLNSRNMGKACDTRFSSMCHNRKFRKQVSQHWSDQKDLSLPRLLISGRHLPLKIAALIKINSSHHYEISKMHTARRFAHGFQHSLCILLYNKSVRVTCRPYKSSEWTWSQHRTKWNQTKIIRGTKFAVAKLTPVQVTKLPL
jgi:hypothetical protein